MSSVPEAALEVLFAPYCGGVARETELRDALHLMLSCVFKGYRPVEGASGHPYEFGWSAVRSPLEVSECSLRFPEIPQLVYDFQVETHQLVRWLMDRNRVDADRDDLPEAFWHWLLLGTEFNGEA